ncbi:hypothetical protein TNCV_4630351 [Trichonephila clavipes]|nr:hypothetical protein TNCV_4630351 [Trichonephila clavipes]
MRYQKTSPRRGRPVEEEAKRERNRSDVTRARVEERRKGARSPKTRSRSTKTQSLDETLEMLMKPYGNDSNTRGVLPVFMAGNEIEGTSFCGFR